MVIIFPRQAFNTTNGESFFGFTIAFINNKLIGATTFKWLRVLTSEEAKMRTVLFLVEMVMGRGFSNCLELLRCSRNSKSLKQLKGRLVFLSHFDGHSTPRSIFLGV